MFKRERNYKKIIATCLIFCFAFANAFTIFSNISYAETKEIGKQNSENTSKNINYDVKFIKSEENQGYEFAGTIDEENLALQLEIEVKKEGYLKSAQILIESENGLSFEIEQSENNEYKVEGNIISLSNISAEGKTKIVLPIKYKESEKIDNLNKKINAKLIGIYVDNSGEEKGISENVVLKLVWNTNTEFNITSELKKYIPFESKESEGIILQTEVKSWIPEKNNFVAKEELEIEAVKIDGYQIDKVIIANKSGETLDENDWSLDENGNIKLKIEKTDETIKSNDLLVTYVLTGNKEIQKPFKINSKINGSIFMFGNNEKSEYELNTEYELNEEVGTIISIEGESQETLKIGNMLTNSLSEENSYITEYETTLKIDISSTEMVENIIIKDLEETFENEEELFEVNSTVKEVNISEENFENILGKDGRIEIYNEENEALAIISKDNYTAQIDAKQITLKTTKPIKEGILVVDIKKEIIDTGYSYEQIKTFSNLNIDYTASYKLSQGVENNIGNVETSIEFEKPQTNSELTISRTTLSTITENKDIELNIKLNNNNEENDLYKNPEFKITFPEYIKNVEVTNIAIANSEEVFNIKDTSINKDANGRTVLNIKLEGSQTSYNTNNITKGTNLIVNTNITLDLYAPSKIENIILEYKNENATSYKNTSENGLGIETAEIEIKAPIGMVSVNKTSNYEETGKSITSVEQGTVTDKIEIFDEEKIATMDIIVMNNNENICNDIKILGRIPFEGNKDFETGKDLGTTIDTSLYGRIAENENNKVNSNIYYSENEEATEDLENKENGWTTDSNIDAKSYLIIPNEYEMESGDVLQYTYQYEIPANLEHNTDIYSSFETIYNNKNEVATKQEISTSDIIGLTTGIGPQISVETSTNIKENSIKEYEKIKYIIKVENTGTETAENVVVKTKIPQWATLAVHVNAATVEEAKGWKLKADQEIITTIDEIKPSETKNVEFYVQANKLPSIEEYYANTEGFTKNEDGTYSIKEAYIDENGEEKYETKTVESLPEVKLICESTITATDLAKEITTTNDSISVTKSNLVAEETVETEETIARVNETIESKIKIKNNSTETMKNIKVTKVLPQGLNYSETYINGYEADGVTSKKIKTTTYNEETREITWTIDELQSGRTVLLIGKFVTAEMKDGVYKDTISTISNIEVNGERYQAGQVDIEVGRPNLEITQTSNQTNQYIKVGDEIEYTFNVKNTGSVRANDVSFKDQLPEEVTIRKLEYKVDGVDVSKVVAKNEDATIYTNILPSGSLEAKITAKVNDIQSKQKTILNTGDVEAKDISKLESNQISHIIERTATTSENTEKPNTDNKTENQPNKENNIKTTYEIKGLVWLENKKDGKRENSERKVSGIEVKLIDAETGKQIEKTVTTADGEYIFKNLENGKYNVVFAYDNSKYGLTEYKKQGVREDVNSDVISIKEGNQSVAITDVITIENGSKSNIDIGLVEATIFDLSLTKRITKVTVQNNSGTKTYDFDNTDLAKVDINGKNLNSSTVIVEYAITVKNEGELDGYAKKIVDYMPKELEFSTELNNSWYKGNDGNLYTEALADKPIAAGKSETVKLVLTKTMTETNTGIVNNQAEIAEDYNKAGTADKDSMSNNKESNEDDMSSADLIIGVQTGNTLIYFSIALTILLAGIVIAIAINKSKIIYKIQAKIGKGV